VKRSIVWALILVLVAGVSPSASADVPFGPNDLAPKLFSRPYTGTKLYFTPARAVRRLNQARRTGMRVIVKLAGSQEHYQSDDGSFDLDRWKAEIDRYRDVALEGFIDDGTIVAHQLVSEAKADDQWGGTVITNDVLDEMAAYSKSIWPDMPTMVRADALDLEEDAAGRDEPWPGGWTWRYLDAASSRYSARKGRAARFATVEQAATDRQGLALAIGMNVLSGGDGSSGIRSPETRDAWAMSPRELREYSAALLAHSKPCSFEMWKYFSTTTYFGKRRIVRAMKDIAAIAADPPTYGCMAPR